MDDAAKHLLLRAKEAVAAAGGAKVVRAEIPVLPVDPLIWLDEQPHGVKGYWAARDGSLEVAAVGEADVVKDAQGIAMRPLFDAIRANLTGCNPEIRYYGGFRFGPWRADDISWRPFGAHRFMLPWAELVRRGERVSLACNLPTTDPERALSDLESALEGIRFDGARKLKPLPQPLSRSDSPDRTGWNKSVGDILSRIRAGELRKFVLARRVIFDFGERLDAFALLGRLRESTRDCYHFCGVHAGGSVAFLGAPPERLYCRMGDTILSEAVAGTRPRGLTPVEDACLGAELVDSEKERREHAIVVEGIREALAPLCVALKHEPVPRIVKLARMQHLVTHVCGTLKPGVGDADIMERLHPTPAVGGYPRAAFFESVSHFEPFDRGWYTGPVGWIGSESSEFAVAIRCALAAGSKLCLFSGAGIVEGSDAEAEWNEVETKVGTFVAALTV